MNPAVQQEVFLRLMAAALATFAVIIIATYFYLVPLGNRSIRAVVPVMHEFMLAAKANDPVRAHTTYSSRTLRSTSVDDIAILLSKRELFDGYAGLQLTAFALQPGESDVAPETATVSGIVSYESRAPMRVRAQLALENDLWRIDWVELGTAPE